MKLPLLIACAAVAFAGSLSTAQEQSPGDEAARQTLAAETGIFRIFEEYEVANDALLKAIDRIPDLKRQKRFREALAKLEAAWEKEIEAEAAMELAAYELGPLDGRVKHLIGARNTPAHTETLKKWTATLVDLEKK